MLVTEKNGLNNNDENLIRQLLFRYLPYWPLFLLLAILGAAGAYMYIRYATPVYEVSATILIKDEKKGLDDSKVLDALNLFGSKKIVENEIEVIKSRTLMQQVVKNLSLYAPIRQQGRVKNRDAYTISPIRIEMQLPDSLKETKRDKIFFTYIPEQEKIKIADKEYQLNKWAITKWGIIRFLPNPRYREQDASERKPLYFSLVDIRKVTRDLLDDLKVAPTSKTSTVINLKINDAVPAKGEDILNELVKVYNKASVDDKNALAINTLDFVDRRLRLVVSELDSVERDIQQYRSREGVIDISEQGKQYLESVGANDEKVSEIDVQTAVLDQVEKYVQTKSDQPGIVPATIGVDNPVLSQLLEKLYTSELEYERLRRTTAENNPILVSVKNEIDKIKPSILENIQSQRRNLEAGKRNLNSTSNRYASVLRTIPQKERELLEISRQQGIKNSIYTFLLQKREETALSTNSTVPDSRLVDKAEAGLEPVSPKRSIAYLLAIALALGVGAGLIGLREVFNQSIVFRSEIEQYTKVPVIGEVLHDTSENPLVIQEGKRTFIAEQFRQLRTSLAYIGINNRKKKILITSTNSGEGKSFITANLGVSLALTGKKVVLLELDLRKPKLSNLFNVSRDVGITNYFIGNKDAYDIIKRTEVNENLFIIPSGAIPPNPSELILNGKLEELLKYLETMFDYIIIDTAPVSPVTDAYILSPFCDATIYVIRHAVTAKTDIKRLDENVKVRGLKNLAIVFNGIKSRGVGGYGQSYGYGYGNAYSYMEEDRKKDSGLLNRLLKTKKYKGVSK